MGHFEIGAFLVAVVLFFEISALPPPTRPNQRNEDKSFWRSYGKENLRLKLFQKENRNKAKNVIVFLGDGMGVQTHTATRIYKGQKEGRNGEEDSLAWESFPYTGQSKTYNTDSQVPDSAGTATALFTGVKTRKGVLGIDGTSPRNTCDPDLVERTKVQSLLHKAVADGKATGIVTNVRITHATPGALYAHIQDREWEDDSKIPEVFRGQGCLDIATQLVHNDVTQHLNLIFGGGRRGFLPESKGGRRLDGKDLIEEWKNNHRAKNHDYQVLQSKSDLESWRHTDFALGLFANSGLDYESERDKSKEPSLSEMVKEAVHRLKRDPDGFFLAVEGGLIDYAHHYNWPKKAFEETLEMEKAVQHVMDMTDEDETLIVVTADHSHAWTINGYPKRGNSIFGYTYEPERGNAILQNDGSLAAWSTISYANGPGFLEHFTNDTDRAWTDIRRVEDTNDLQYRSPAMFQTKDGYETHAGEDVPVLARGPWAHLFSGVHEQSHLNQLIEFAAGWSELSKDSHYTNSAASRAPAAAASAGAASLLYAWLFS